MSGASTFLMFLRVSVSLAIVLAMIWGAARIVKKRAKVTRRDGTTTLDIVARRPVGRRSSLIVVDAGDLTLLIGVTDQNVALIADLTGSEEGLVDGSAVKVSGSEKVVGPVKVSMSVAASENESAAVPESITGDDVSLSSIDRATQVDHAGHAEHPQRDSIISALRDITVRR